MIHSSKSFLLFRGQGLQHNVYTADFAIVSDPMLVNANSKPVKSHSTTAASKAILPVQSLLVANTTNNAKSSAATMNRTQSQQTQTDMVPVSTVTPNQGGSPYRNNGVAHSRAGQLEQARFRLLFIVWPAMFGLSMAL